MSMHENKSDTCSLLVLLRLLFCKIIPRFAKRVKCMEAHILQGPNTKRGAAGKFNISFYETSPKPISQPLNLSWAMYEYMPAI